MISEPGVKIWMSKLKKKKFWTTLESWTIIFGNITFQKKFDFGPFMLFIGISKQKFAISKRKSVIRKNFTAQKSLRKSFYSILGGQKNFWFFLLFLFFATPFTFWIFFGHFSAYFYILFGLQVNLTTKVAPRIIF